MRINYNYFAVTPKNRKLETVRLHVHDLKTAKQELEKIQLTNNTMKVYLERIVDSYPHKTQFYVNENWISDENFVNLLLTNRL